MSIPTRYKGCNTSKLKIEELYCMKIKVDRERKRETDEDTRYAIRLKSATEFLREQ